MREKVLITGASSGIGEKTAILLSRNYDIVLHGKDLDRLNNVKNNLSHGEHMIWNFDLANVENLENAFKDFLSLNDISINHFVCNAGIANLVPLKIVNFDKFDMTLKINLIAPALLAKVLANKKLNKSLKNIVFISSHISGFGAKAMSMYGASKSGLDGLMRSLAVELAPNVRVNSIAPGTLKTRMTENMYQNDEFVERIDKTYPLGAGETLDIANTIEFLISPNAKWITGQQLMVDGGRTINISG